MVIIETAVFTRQVLKVLSEEEYRRFQLSLAKRPEVGKLIKGGGGLRKVRWAVDGRGKRGGVRVIILLGRPPRATALAVDLSQERT
jgi:hypothetical protein